MSSSTAADVGVPCTAVMTGGIGGDELRGAGTAALHDDAAAARAGIEYGPIGSLAR